MKTDLVDNAWQVLGEECIEYNWNYRKKICVKCPIETQNKLECYKVDNYRMINGEDIQETHCVKLEKARANKFRSRIKSVWRLLDNQFQIPQEKECE